MHSVGWIVAWLLGCGLGLYVAGLYPPSSVWVLESKLGVALIVLGLTSLLVAAIGGNDKQARWAALFASAALLGCGSTLVRQPPITPAHLAYYNAPDGERDGDVTVVGTISAEPVYLDTYQRVHLSAEEIRLADANGVQAAARPVKGELLALLPRYPSRQIGERLSLTGALTRPPRISGFDYAAYLARQGVYSYMRFPKSQALNPPSATGWTQLVSSARERARGSLRRSIPEPQAALAVGVVVGDRTSLSPEIEDAFKRSGTMHVLAISGQNIALLVGFIWLVFGGRTGARRMPAWLMPLVLILLAFYTLFTGASASVVRAAIMAAILLFAPVAGRRYDPAAALAVSAFLMTLLDPDGLLDAGFQLSFGALLGMIYVSPPLYHALKRMRVPGVVALLVSGSLGAQFGTIPLSALVTGGFSLLSPLATLTIDGALLPLMVAGILTVIVDSMLPGAGTITGLFAWACAAWMTSAVSLWSALPLVYASVAEIPFTWIALYYAALFGLVWAVTGGRKRVSPLLSSGRVTLGLGGATLLLWLLVLALVFDS